MLASFADILTRLLHPLAVECLDIVFFFKYLMQYYIHENRVIQLPMQLHCITGVQIFVFVGGQLL